MQGSPPLIRICIFASGTGSNAQKIIDRFKGHPRIRVALIMSNKPDSGVISLAARENIASLIIEKEKFFRENAYVDDLKSREIDFIVLAGFLWKIPLILLRAYSHRIINIHPALLPKYGGKGMHGSHIHESVIAAGEKASGITIHEVDEEYDRGKIIFQADCRVEPGDSSDSLAKKIQVLEHQHYPRIIEEWIDVQNKVKR